MQTKPAKSCSLLNAASQEMSTERWRSEYQPYWQLHMLLVTHPAPNSAKKSLTHGVNNEIQLPIVDCNIDLGCQKLINNINDRSHEVLSHVLKDLSGLTWLESERRQVLTERDVILKQLAKGVKVQFMTA